MRINVYHHEIEWMAKRGGGLFTKSAEGNIWYGVRFYTEAPLEHEPGDDDSAAITLWAPWTRRRGADTTALRKIAQELLDACDEIDRAETRRKRGDDDA
jgi:hypothetical protein